MMKRSFTIFFLFIIPLFSFSQKHINRFRHKQRQGLWIVYQDSTKTVVDNIGRYRKGNPKGTWKYYDPKGRLIKKEHYSFRTISITYYHPNGKIKNKGKAKIVTTDSMIHYFYYGNWLVYDTTGELSKKQLYKDGTKISEINYKTSAEKNVNDSLVDVVRKMELSLRSFSDSLTAMEAKYGKSSKAYERCRDMGNLNALNVQKYIDRMILKFGYPGKTLVGKEYAIVFSIISSSDLKYKEKHYTTVIDAADKGELDWEDVAFFVDKVKVAKKEKQLYGTQFIVDEKYHQLYFPIEEKSKLNERRRKIGLEEVDISKMDDSVAY